MIYYTHTETFLLKSHVINFVMQMSLANQRHQHGFHVRGKMFARFEQGRMFFPVKKVIKSVCREWI